MSPPSCATNAIKEAPKPYPTQSSGVAKATNTYKSNVGQLQGLLNSISHRT
jgi:hypothetical protein